MKRYLRKRSSRMILMILVTAGALMLFFICTLLFWSQGRLENYLNHDGDVLKGSVSEITRVKINGIKQGMIIKGKSDQNPVLLFLHGGPGNPEYVLAKNQVTELEEAFTVCWWEQRGSGIYSLLVGTKRKWHVLYLCSCFKKCHTRGDDIGYG